MAQTTDSTAKTTGQRLLEGVVVRISGAKTVSVEIARDVTHPMYNKRRRITKRYLAHDPKEEAKVGDVVVIQEHRPISARKRWLVVERRDGVSA